MSPGEGKRRVFVPGSEQRRMEAKGFPRYSVRKRTHLAGSFTFMLRISGPSGDASGTLQRVITKLHWILLAERMLESQESQGTD